MLDPECPFCSRLAASDAAAPAIVIADGFPITDGHVLVVPARHIARIEELTRDEWSGLFGVVHDVTRTIVSAPDVAGVNIGVNSGEAAGQTVMHAHVHVVPRRSGDSTDPRGGVRWLMPERAAYWEPS